MPFPILPVILGLVALGGVAIASNSAKSTGPGHGLSDAEVLSRIPAGYPATLDTNLPPSAAGVIADAQTQNKPPEWWEQGAVAYYRAGYPLTAQWCKAKATDLRNGINPFAGGTPAAQPYAPGFYPAPGGGQLPGLPNPPQGQPGGNLPAGYNPPSPGGLPVPPGGQLPQIPPGFGGGGWPIPPGLQIPGFPAPAGQPGGPPAGYPGGTPPPIPGGKVPAPPGGMPAPPGGMPAPPGGQPAPPGGWPAQRPQGYPAQWPYPPPAGWTPPGMAPPGMAPPGGAGTPMPGGTKPDPSAYGLPQGGWIGPDRRTHYVLQAGDYGSKIAKKWGKADADVPALVKENPQIGNWSKQLPGTDLFIPAYWWQAPAGVAVVETTRPGPPATGKEAQETAAQKKAKADKAAADASPAGKKKAAAARTRQRPAAAQARRLLGYV